MKISHLSLGILILFCISALVIISNNNLALYNGKNFLIFKNIYFSWIDTIISNISSLTGNAIQMDWVPK